MAKRVTVWDAEGNKLLVRSIDAKEIVDLGGSYEPPAKQEVEKRRCAFIKSDGEQCGNDALEGSEFCHIRSHQ